MTTDAPPVRKTRAPKTMSVIIHHAYFPAPGVRIDPSDKPVDLPAKVAKQMVRDHKASLPLDDDDDDE